MAGSDRSKWIGPCRQALIHLLLVEHWKTASKADLTGWRTEIIAFRRQMAASVKGGRGMHGKFEKMFSKAWPRARQKAVERLVQYFPHGLVTGGRPSRIVEPLTRSCPRSAPTCSSTLPATTPSGMKGRGKISGPPRSPWSSTGSSGRSTRSFASRAPAARPLGGAEDCAEGRTNGDARALTQTSFR